MSISDLIIVMKEGVIQQIGKPQDVYEEPVNLFVAKFLGTPPINVFHARVEGGGLYLGEDRIADTKAPEGPVTVGIRPEGFIPDPEGPLACKLHRVEVMGRDISVVSSHEASENAVIRSIISSAESEVVRALLADDSKPAKAAEESASDDRIVRFKIRPAKLYLFDTETGNRLEL